MLLEFSQYLENYLWPNYSADATDAHLLSIVVMVNEKFRERVPAWEVPATSRLSLMVLYKSVFSYLCNSLLLTLPSVLRHCWLGVRKSIWPVKID